jgi:hypothetical protein
MPQHQCSSARIVEMLGGSTAALGTWLVVGRQLGMRGAPLPLPPVACEQLAVGEGRAG